MPLPDSFFQPKDKNIATREYNNPAPVEPDDPLNFPFEHLNDDDKVPANSLLREVRVVRETYFKPAEPVGVDQDAGCTIYKIHFEARQFIRTYFIFGVDEHLLSEVPSGVYQIDRYVRVCANGRVTVTRYHENPAIGPDTHDAQTSGDPSFKQSEELLEQEEGDDGVNPPPGIGGIGQGDGPRFWVPPDVIMRPFAAHGFTEGYDEGDHHISNEYIWKLEPPTIVEGCVVTAQYRAAVRTTRWRISDKRRVGLPTVTYMEPPVRMTRSWTIPGCDPAKPIAYEGREEKI